MTHWRDVPGYEGRYQVTPSGEVRVLFENGASRTKSRDGLMSPSTRDGYRILRLHDANGRRKSWLVHQLVMLTWGEPKPSHDHEIAHVNGVRDDNRIENLCWKTRVENQHDRFIHGTHLMGVNHPSAKMDESKVRDIRERRANGETQVSLSKTFGLSRRAIRMIIDRTTWQHVAAA